MTEKRGHFEKGVWIEDIPAHVALAGAEACELRPAEVSDALYWSTRDMEAVTRGLVGTVEGRQYLENILGTAQEELHRSLDGFLAHARSEVLQVKAAVELEAVPCPDKTTS